MTQLSTEATSPSSLFNAIYKELEEATPDKQKEILSSSKINLLRDAAGNTFLMKAILNQNMSLIDILIASKAHIEEQREQDGYTALHLAAYQGHASAVIALLKAKAKVDSMTIMEDTPLILAADLGHQAVVIALLEAKANVNVTTREKDTPLILAVNRGNIVVVNALIKAKAMLEAQNEQELTALQLAANDKNIRIIDVLIRAKDIQPQ